MNRRFLKFWLCVLAACAPALCRAERTVLLLSDGNNIYRLISDGIREKVRSDLLEINLKDNPQRALEKIQAYQPDAVVALGNSAAVWAREKIVKTPVVVSGVIYQSNPELFRSMTGVSLDEPGSSYVRVICGCFAGVRTLGLIYNKERGSGWIEEIRDAARACGIKVAAEPVEAESQISRALENLMAQKIGVILMTYDPLVMNAQSFKFMVDFSIKNRVGIIVPSRVLLKNGGLASVEADYKDVGDQTAALLQRVLRDRSVRDPLEFPRKEQIGFNMKMSEALSIEIGGACLEKADYVHR